ncbi:SurA N-terminal domain-containing protein [Actinokineospora sp. G85]|uniref:SurA N-terminal domain-containing protein n=1 Tax=Actinokineospora sp. G85 TaxID=3406626 RepID=UPI003C71DC67
MTTAIRRRRVVVAALSVVLGLVLAGCGSGPSQVNAAAIVNGKVISVGQVQHLVDRAVELEPGAKVLADQRKLGDLSREVLGQLITHELISAYMAQNPVRIDPAQVSQLAEQIRSSLQPLPEGGASPEAIVANAATKVLEPEFLARDYLALAQIGGSEISSLKVTIDYAVLSPQNGGTGSLRDKALAKARELAAGYDEAKQVQQRDTASGELQWDTGTFEPLQINQELQGSALFGTPPGNVVAFQASAENAAWVIALVRDRQVGPPTADAGQTPLAATISMGQRVLQQWVDKAGVNVSPRYGVYDKIAMRLAPSEATSAGVLLPVKGAPQQ